MSPPTAMVTVEDVEAEVNQVRVQLATRQSSGTAATCRATGAPTTAEHRCMNNRYVLRRPVHCRVRRQL
jgi:hypothetical protein